MLRRREFITLLGGQSDGRSRRGRNKPSGCRCNVGLRFGIIRGRIH
jgi:hypothetical protein